MFARRCYKNISDSFRRIRRSTQFMTSDQKYRICGFMPIPILNNPYW
jgi:hypothetical protein